MEAHTIYFLSKKRRSLIILGLLFSFLIGFEVGIHSDVKPINPDNFLIKDDTSLPIEPAAIECSKRQGVPCA